MEAINDLEMFDEVMVCLFNNGHVYTLYKKDFAIEAISSFNFYLKNSLINKAKLDSSIIEDIGHLWNERLQNVESLADKGKNKKVKTWMGVNSLLWEVRGISTWFYNQAHKIIFKITPTYKWHFQDHDENEGFITYEEFIKNYKPLATLELSKERAQEWLDKTEELLTIMQKNYEQCKVTHEIK